MKRQITTGICALLLCSAAVMVSGCFYIRMTEPMLRVSHGRYFPKNPKFTVMPSDEHDSTVIDFSAVYAWREVFTRGSGIVQTDFNYFRFWPSGKCILNYTRDRLPTSWEADSFDSASFGFFNMDGTNIVIEIYVPDSYNRYYGVVKSNEIHVTRIDLKYAAASYTYSTTVDEHYIRHYVGAMSRQPDWSPTGMLYRVESPPSNQR